MKQPQPPLNEPFILHINNLLASSGNTEFAFFTASSCYYAGKNHVYLNGDWAVFNVVGWSSLGGLAVYTFTAQENTTFSLYGAQYKVLKIGENTAIVTLVRTE